MQTFSLFCRYHEPVKNVIFKLWQLLRIDEQDVTKNIGGIDREVRGIMQKLGVNNQDGQVVEGQKTKWRCVIDKTTPVKVVYNKISHLFDGCSFLKDVRDATE